ncbi:alpha/beta hydrolase [Bryobacter aggregatus]|uniref:alpha/beta hydrolase n=1 Tax=Bryobacter aggregatus TaxID=360054 RepID=UPI0005676BDA|nr:alpha/beta hydrolase [Bryobacter aggregatus]
MTLTKAPILDPDVRVFVQKLAASQAPPIYMHSYEAARQILEDLQAKPPRTRAVARVDHDLPVGPGGKTRVRIFRPVDIVALLPTVIYFHGGGWVMGSAHTHDHLMEDLSEETNAAVVFVEYTRSPESQFPGPVEQAYAVTKYLAEHGRELDLSQDRIAVAGDSAGANLAAVVAILAKERGGPKIAQQTLFYPVTDASMSSESYHEFAEGPWLQAAGMRWFWDAYAPRESDRHSYMASPLLASPSQLEKLPVATILTAENDVLRDEGEAYARKMMEAGVRVTGARMLGTIHDFVMLNELRGSAPTQMAIAIASSHLRTALGNEADLMGKHVKRFI